jgi:multicomponent Na+:H+ antiporter subunit E
MKLLRKIPMLLRFAAFYVKELVLSNLRVAYDALTPTHYMSPAFVGIPLDVKTDFEILLLANLITMTPGTVSLDVSTDRRMLYLHAMYVTDPETLRRKIKSDLERRVIELLR